MLGEQIKRTRNELDISQEELARRLGVSYRTILRWEKGETKPRGRLKEHVLNWLNRDENKQKSTTIPKSKGTFD